MTLDEIRGLAVDDLKKASADTREELFKKRFQTAMEAVDNTKAVRELRKRIARLETVLRERTKAAAPAAAAGKGK